MLNVHKKKDKHQYFHFIKKMIELVDPGNWLDNVELDNKI